jgi:energy-coupling factor transporter ATP-binding protein EcfA2
MTTQPLLVLARKQPAWQSDLLRRLVTGGALSDVDSEEVLVNLERTLSGGDVKLKHGRALEEADLPDEGRRVGSPSLTRLGDISNVGTLAGSTTLSFAHNGMTAVFGNNGAGKSTVVRLLKQSCRAADGGEAAHPNVFESTFGVPQTFTLDVAENGKTESIARKVGEGPCLSLGSISIFDASCAERYVSKALPLAYVPRELHHVARLADAQQALAQQVAQQIDELERAAPRFDEIEAGTEAGGLMRSEAPDADAIRALASTDDDQDERRRELERRLRELDVAEARAGAAKQLDEIERFGRTVTELIESVSDDAIERWHAARRATEEIGREVEQLGRELHGLPLSGVATPSWRAMWSAAQRWVAEQDIDNQRCPMCQRVHDAESSRRFEDLRRLAQGELETQRLAAQGAETAARDALSRAQSEALAQAARLERDESEWAVATVEALGSIAERVNVALLGEKKPPAVAFPNPAFTAGIVALKRQLDELDAIDHPAERAGLERELSELDARRQLSARLEDALALATIRERVRVLEDMRIALGTRKLSNDQRKLAEARLTDRIKDELHRARRDLRIEDLGVDLRTSTPRGQPQTSIELAANTKAKLHEVLSTGERRLLGLAHFLAEVCVADHDGTIVLDDPVSSLDADRRLVVARRLAEESRRRQVIVFTHDAHFLMLLARECEQRRLPVRVLTMVKVGDTSGLVREGVPWDAASAEKRVKQLRNRYLKNLRKVAKDDPDRYSDAAAGVVRRLRETWERVTVEALGDVVTPGDFEVHTKRIDRVVMNVELRVMIRDEMDQLSHWIHDQGAGMTKEPPQPPEMERLVHRLELALQLIRTAREGTPAPDLRVEQRSP